MGVSKLLLPGDVFAIRLSSILEDDFFSYTDAQQWTKLAADSGASVAVSTTGGVGGLLRFTTGATDNNEASIVSTNLNNKYVNNKPMLYEAGVSYTENATNKANIAAGFSTIATANFLLDDGGDVATSFTGAIIYKIDGGTVWKCCSSLTTTQTKTTSTTTAGGAQKLRIEIMFVSSTVAEISYFVDGAPLLDASQSKPTPIKHSLTYTGAAAMGPMFYVKAGGSGGELVDLDYIVAAQGR